eukprot:CAMPEP_0113436418 /NCGR_PEP_ID=MMETSP0013_2-20120614/36842_1 /TAXON_ID=2843 ORGANISM="Skeletonema costatum, Strain 1716" /NCGR_SAMPLE_ID=MMETSP0013_2 /ASSEMBLY_ACC=CAM_ASM_000158 /LENGTH=158 /DNA_ID=CAMNT_0000326945 /DNA_START=27 /DNA_END=502 /DNA_ORIENTATION=- /assembly_acc=CAM_ASM_000158
MSELQAVLEARRRRTDALANLITDDDDHDDLLLGEPPKNNDTKNESDIATLMSNNDDDDEISMPPTPPQFSHAATTLLALSLCLMSSINVLKKVRHSQRIDRWGHTMVNYRNQLLQSADKERGGAMMKRQQYNQTWEELPQCVQRYLQRVAPEPLPNL